jgi:polyisoprenoid-binding protein YceI
MKTLAVILMILSSQMVLAKNLVLSQSKAEYTVKHLFKTVKGESSELKGKMVCEKEICEFLVAIPAKSFVSSDSNRDLNMQTILEVTKYTIVTVKGTLPESDLAKPQYEIKSLVSFHGIEKPYTLQIKNGSPLSGHFVLLLEDHKVERPSLLMAKIDNQVPINFTFEWKE